MTGVVVFPLASPGVGPETFRSTYCLCSYLPRMYRSTTFISGTTRASPRLEVLLPILFARTLPIRSWRLVPPSTYQAA